jgi:hypothetical protein
MIVKGIEGLRDKLYLFRNFDCVVVICSYNGGKSSKITDMLSSYFDTPYYVTFIDQSKPNFSPRSSSLKFEQGITNKTIIFDEISDDLNRNVSGYVKVLTVHNFVIILSNPYGSSTDGEKEINLFKEKEKDLIPKNTLVLFVNPK